MGWTVLTTMATVVIAVVAVVTFYKQRKTDQEVQALRDEIEYMRQGSGHAEHLQRLLYTSIKDLEIDQTVTVGKVRLYLGGGMSVAVSVGTRHKVWSPDRALSEQELCSEFKATVREIAERKDGNG